MRNLNMKIFWVISLMIGLFQEIIALTGREILKYHYPGFHTTAMTTYINGTDTQIPSTYDTPDYRIPERHFVPSYQRKYLELERPYRNSPAYKTHYYSHYNRGWRGHADMLYNMGCYCNTVYRRLTLLAGCAVITSRHIVTTATPTVLILNSYGHEKNLEDILGGWYDTNVNSFNSSIYMTPSRIHFHPRISSSDIEMVTMGGPTGSTSFQIKKESSKSVYPVASYEYMYPHDVNVSHPIPAIFDLAIYAATHTFRKSGLLPPYATVMICGRAGSGRYEYVSTIPRRSDNSLVAGFQFIKAFNRRPLPWYRYVVVTKSYLFPCPKSDWQWYHCIMGEYWGRFGFDSGGGMSSGYNDNWRYDGLAGICAFSLKLRSKQTVHYFTVVDTYPVLDFFYDAFLGLIKPVYMDNRFEDTKWAAPVAYSGEWFPYTYGFGYEYFELPGQFQFYRRR